MHIAAQPVQFGDGDMGAKLLGLAQRCGELWSFFQSVGTFASLDLNKLTSDL